MQTYSITIRRSWDLAIRKSELGQQLYSKWREVRKHQSDQAFHTFPSFFFWAIASGYYPGAHLIRLDTTAPYSPVNCGWRKPDSQRLAESWDRTVADFRQRLAAAETNNLDGGIAIKRTAPGAGTSEDGKGKNDTPIIGEKGQ